MTTATLPPTTVAIAVGVERTEPRRALHLPGVTLVTLASAVTLVPWTVHLARSLPTSYVLTGWSSAWVGFDVVLTAVLAATGLLARRRDPLWPAAAFASAALLVADAWFDVTTSGTAGLLVPVLTAALLELPLAALLVHHAVRATRAATVPAPRATSQEGAATEG